MIWTMGHSWAYTVFAVIFLFSALGPVAVMVYGIKWRKAKKEKRKVRPERQTMRRGTDNVVVEGHVAPASTEGQA
jgi:membrane protein required for beta-lactamase induction